MIKFNLMTSLENDLLWVIGGVITLAIVWWLTRRHQQQQQARQEPEPRTQTVNKTNYNIDNTGKELYPEGRLEPEEARRILASWEKEDYIPSDEEFRRVQQAINNQ